MNEDEYINTVIYFIAKALGGLCDVRCTLFDRRTLPL